MLGHQPPIPLFIAFHSAPSASKASCMQNRISKTLLTLLRKLISVKKRNAGFERFFNKISKVSKVFEILFCKTPGISGFISVFDSACFSLFGLCCLHGFLVKAVYPASRNNRNADSVAHFSSFCGLKWYKIHLFSRGGGKKGWERGMKLCY